MLLGISPDEARAVVHQCLSRRKKGTLLAGAQIYEMESQGKRMKYKLAPGTQPSGLQSGTEEGWISTHQKGYHRCLTLSISAGWSYRHWQMGPHKDWNDAFSKYRTQLEEIKGIQEEVTWKGWMSGNQKSVLKFEVFNLVRYPTRSYERGSWHRRERSDRTRSERGETGLTRNKKLRTGLRYPWFSSFATNSRHSDVTSPAWSQCARFAASSQPGDVAKTRGA